KDKTRGKPSGSQNIIGSLPSGLFLASTPARPGMFASYFAFPAGVIGGALLLLKKFPPNRQIPDKSCGSKGRFAVGDGTAVLAPWACEAGEKASTVNKTATEANSVRPFK